MGQIAQNYLSDDKKGANEAILETVAPYSTMGIFRPANSEKKPLGTGPIFTQNSSQKLSSVDGVKAPTNINYKTLEDFDFNKLIGILTQEILALSKLDKDRLTQNDREKILNALYAINPNKYGFIAANDEKFHPQDIIRQPEIKKRRDSLIIRPELTVGSLRLVTPTEKPVTPITPIAETVSIPKEKIKIPTKITPIPLTTAIPKTLPQENRENSFLKRMGEEISTDDAIASALKDTPEVTPDTSETATTLASSNSAIENIAPIHESPLETIMEIENNVIPSPQTTEEGVQELSPKIQTVGKLIDTITPYYGDDWARWATPTSRTQSNNANEEEKLPAGLSLEKIPSWRDSPAIQKNATFLNDIVNIKSEQDLITKYIPSYVNPNNPSSWVSISTFNTNEILNADEGVYGLMHDTRLEISSFLQQLGAIDEATDFAQLAKKYTANRLQNYQAYLSFNSKLTIHDYYEEIRKRIAEADKYEQK